MQIHVHMAGTTPLLMHSDAGVNPEHPLNKQKSLLTRKTTSKRTAEENREIRRLEWLLGLYTDDDGKSIVYPTGNVKRCFQEAGKVTKQGTQITRGLSFAALKVPFAHPGADGEIADLFEDARFTHDCSVGVGQKRVMRTRPRFNPWEIELAGEVFDDIMDLTDLQRIASLAGRAIGLGDARVLGFGRFSVEIEAT